MAHGVQHTEQPFPYRFSRVLHRGEVTVGRQHHPSQPVIASFLAPWSAPDILCLLFQRPALVRQLHLHTQPYQLFLPGFGHPLISVLPQEASSLFLTTTFNRKVRMFILEDFIHHLPQLFRHMKAIEGYFLNRIGLVDARCSYIDCIHVH